MGAGNTGGTDIRVVVRDAAVLGTDAAGVARGTGGAVGSPAGRRSMAGARSTRWPPRCPSCRAETRARTRRSAPSPMLRRSTRRLIALSRAAPRAGEIVIDEVLVNPAGDDLGREWIEIASLAAEPLDLSQLHLATASTDVAVVGRDDRRRARCCCSVNRAIPARTAARRWPSPTAPS